MPVVGETGRRVKASTPKPKKQPKLKKTARPSTPDQADRARAAQPPPTPDQADRNRSPKQKAADKRKVNENVRSSRQKAVRKRNAGSWGKAIRDAVTGPGGVYGAGGPNRGNVVSPAEARKLKAKGVKVRPATKAEAADIGAQVRTQATGGMTRAAEATIRGLAQDPKKSVPATLKGGRDMLTGIPGAFAKITVDTAEGAKDGDPLRPLRNIADDAKKDLERRYGDIDEPGGVKKMADRVSKEGAAAEIVDAAGLATAGAAGAGRALGTAARAGKLGDKAKRVATERPKLRTSGGEAREQDVSKNLIVATGQAATDAARKRAHKRRLKKAERGDTGADVVDVETKAGEVTPVRKRARAKAQRRDVAQRKGRSVVRLKREQAEEVARGSNRNIAGLSSLERTALAFAVKFGIRDPDRAVEVLTAHRARVVAERERSGKQVPKRLRRTNDNLREIDRLLSKPEAFSARVAQAADLERRRGKRVAQGDPGLSGEQGMLRVYAQQAEHLGLERADGEASQAFVSRVRKAAKQAGLQDPGYFKSEKRPTVRYSDYATGGPRAVQTDKTYTGALHRTGMEDLRPEAGLSQAFARNIKRKHNWNLVADNFDAHTLDWSRDKNVSQLLDELDKRGIDPSSVALWNPGRYRQAASKADDGEMTGGDEPVVSGIDKGVDNSAVKSMTAADLATMPEDFRKATGFSLVPKTVFDEIHADTRPSGKFARGWEIAKGKQSRLLLGTNPTWLQFQVASNAILAGLAGTGPRDVVKAQLWWRGLSKAEREAVEPYIGVSAFRDAHAQTKMGAAANGGLINAYRAFKQTPFFHRPRKALRGGAVSDLNPLDLLFRADAAQNNAFRKAVLYSQIKRDAYRRMGRDVGQMQRIQEQLMDSLTLGPKDQMRQVIRDRKSLEAHAKHVNDFLGDYMTYTAKERRYLARNVMFYGFLRFSLRYTFWTMPTKHPIVSSIVAQLGRMQTEEVRQLLGGDALPYSLGKLYFADDGKLKSVNVSRMNPTTNALIEALAELPNPKKAVGFLPPIAQAALNQIAGENITLGRDYRAGGKEDTAEWMDDRWQEAEDRSRIFAADMAGLIAPYRSWEKAVTKGAPLGDDSLAWDPRPTKFGDRDTQLGIERQLKQDTRSTGKRLRDDLLLPFKPQPDRAREQTALATARKELRQITKQIDETPESKRSKDGFFYTKPYQDLLDRQKAARERVNRLQAQGEPAPSRPRLSRRPKSPRELVDEKREKLRSSNPREELERRLNRERAKQAIVRGG